MPRGWRRACGHQEPRAVLGTVGTGFCSEVLGPRFWQWRQKGPGLEQRGGRLLLPPPLQGCLLSPPLLVLPQIWAFPWTDPTGPGAKGQEKELSAGPFSSDKGMPLGAPVLPAVSHGPLGRRWRPTHEAAPTCGCTDGRGESETWRRASRHTPLPASPVPARSLCREAGCAALLPATHQLQPWGQLASPSQVGPPAIKQS